MGLGPEGVGVRRRDFIKVMAGTAVARPLAARAQQPAMPVVGFLHVAFPGPYTQQLLAFRQGLKQSGYVEGQNVAIEYRWANNENDRLPELAADLVRRQVTVIVAAGGPSSALAAKAATSTIPIVLVFGADAVRLGLVASLNRPGGNVTGVTFLTTELMAKRLELLRELIPQATTVAYLADLRSPVTGPEMLRDTLAAAGVLGRQIAVVEARSDRDFEPAFATFVERQAGALVVGPSQLFDSNRDQLVALAASHKMPAIYQAREYVLDGGLMSYGASQVDAFRVGGLYAGQILKGEPANLPVQQATKVELVINLKTAKALGLEVPLSLMIRADEIME
jgi:putative ABC transport system substrate-binding protein